MKIECLCSKFIVDSTDGHRTKTLLHPDQTWNQSWELIEKAVLNPTDSAQEREHSCMNLRLNIHTRIIYQCPNCGRVILHDHDGKLHFFKPEDPNSPKNLMAE